MRRFVVRPSAERDIAEGAGYYAAQGTALGAEYLTAVDDVMGRIRAEPDRFPIVHRQLRRALIRRFPYGIYFIAAPEVIQVVACIHLRRHPREWKRRS